MGFAIDGAVWTLLVVQSAEALSCAHRLGVKRNQPSRRELGSAVAQRGLPVQPEHADFTASPRAVTETVPTGFINGRYRVKRFLGEGGKKRAYLAHDTHLARDIAFSIIKTDGLDDEGLQRIRREAQAMARLGDHPNVVTVHDFGEEHNQPYLVTQFMEGGDVEALLDGADGHRLSVDHAIELAIQVCKALEYAHRHGVVHRDLKPGNVWLTADGAAKLGDFGLAVLGDETRLTRVGVMVGTPSYMAPEQALGGAVDSRSDLYSLGCMLYEMLAGRPPFVGENPFSVITQHLMTDPIAPSWHRPEIPSALDALILRLLQKEPSHRTSSATEVREALSGLAVAPGRPAGVSQETSQAEGPPAGSASVLFQSGQEGALQPSDNPLYREVFIGREAELQQVHAAFDKTLASDGSVVALAGEPGIGKTALCSQLITYASVRGGRVLVGHCFEETSLSSPYAPFVEALRTYLASRPSAQLAQELAGSITELLPLIPELGERLLAWLPAQKDSSGAARSRDSEEDRWRLFQTLIALLRGAAAARPLLLVLEDLQWADRGVVDLLMHLARHVAGSRMLVLLTYRDTEINRAHPLATALGELRRAHGFERLQLRSLQPDEVRRMVEAFTGADPPAGLVSLFQQQTEGNPLFVQEVLRHLAEEGLMSHDLVDGRWRASVETLGATSLPNGLRELIGWRLARLSNGCVRLLSIAAVIGQEFSLETIEQVSGQLQEEVFDQLEEALTTAVIHEKQERRGAVRFRFANGLFRRALYSELQAPRRILLHQQVGRALETQYSTRAGEHAAELAEHFSYSTAPEDAAKTLRYAEQGAGRASEVYAYDEASRLLKQALQAQGLLETHEPSERCDLLLKLGEALLGAGIPQRAAQEVAPDAIALAERLGDGARASRACNIGILGLVRHGGSAVLGTPAFQRWAERADRYAAPDSASRVRADMALAASQRSAGLVDQANALQERALDLAQKLDDEEALFFVAWLAEASSS